MNHLLFEHNFNLGLADNLGSNTFLQLDFHNCETTKKICDIFSVEVYFDEFYEVLKTRFESLKCFYCEKIFYDKQVLKEHMRKKQHKCINPENKQFDKYYMINYLVLFSSYDFKKSLFSLNLIRKLAKVGKK